MRISGKVDILAVMIGINDCFRNYPIGQPGDKENSTFYGGLDNLVKGLTAKFPTKDGKKIFLLIYPHYDADSKFRHYVKAMYDVADRYSLPVCDLSLILGVSPYNDPEYFYWRKYKDNIYHSPHPTQITSHLIAESVSNFIQSHYSIASKVWEENTK